jgi:hypothetical protein
MKRPLITLFLLASLPLLYGQMTRYGQGPPKAKPGVDYPVKVHISGIRIRQDCSSRACAEVARADAVLNGQKIELTGFSPTQINLVPGDYTARLLKVGRKGAANPLFDEYELLLPDRTIWSGIVTGIFE